MDVSEIKSAGFAHIKLLEPDEVGVVNGLIQNTIQAATKVHMAPLSKYHKLVAGDEHEVMSRKINRVFSDDDVRKILGFKSIKNLIASFPGYGVSNVSHGKLMTEDRPEIYFRLVRPHAASDVGPYHCDSWYHDLYKNGYDGETFKVWIAVETSAGENGLVVYPNSHLVNLKYKAVETDQGPRPVPDFDMASDGGVLVPTVSGDAIVFSDKLLHRGAVNNAETTRVSIEITLCRVH